METSMVEQSHSCHSSSVGHDGSWDSLPLLRTSPVIGLINGPTCFQTKTWGHRCCAPNAPPMAGESGQPSCVKTCSLVITVWASRAPGLATVCCQVLLGDVAAAVHGDGAERRAKPHQQCGGIVSEMNAARQIKHPQVNGADGQVLNCHVRHLRQGERIKTAIAQKLLL